MGRQERRWRNGARLPSTWPDNSGDEPLTAQADQATADGVAQNRERDTDRRTRHRGASGTETPPERPRPPELHSGHKLARRYRLEECVTRLDGFSSWRAVDEKLRRAVGVHLLPADHPRARSVLAAARSSALLGDPRFVQVLDAVEENDLVYVVHEWLPDATELTALLAAGPAGAARRLPDGQPGLPGHGRRTPRGLAHLRLTPSAVLRTLDRPVPHPRPRRERRPARHHLATHPQRTDTEAIGALLYAALTQRWPYESDAYGLSGLPKGVGLIAPDQVRAGVHRGLSELAMRALVNDGATASRQEPPCTTPEELAKAVADDARASARRSPRSPPRPSTSAPRTSRAPTAGPRRTRGATQPVTGAPPPPLQSRTGKALKWAVSALLIAALGPRQLAARGRPHGPGEQGRRPEHDPDDGRQRQEHRTRPVQQAADDRGRRGVRPGRQRPRERRATSERRTTATPTRTGGPTTTRRPDLGAAQGRRRHHLRPGLGPAGRQRRRCSSIGDTDRRAVRGASARHGGRSSSTASASSPKHGDRYHATLKTRREAGQDPVRSGLAHGAAAVGDGDRYSGRRLQAGHHRGEVHGR